MMQRIGSVAVTGTEPITLIQAKAHLRVTNANDDAYIGSLISASRGLFERICRRSIVQQTFKVTLDQFPEGAWPWWDGVRDGALVSYQGRFLPIPRPPLVSVQNVTTYDLNNGATVMDPTGYFVDVSDPDQYGRICLNVGTIWPVNLRQMAAVEVAVTAGYAQIPPEIVQATLMMVAFLYTSRGDCNEEACTSCGAMGWIKPFQIMDFAIAQKARRRSSFLDG